MNYSPSEEARRLMHRGLDMCFPDSRHTEDILDRFLEYMQPAFDQIRREAEGGAYLRVDEKTRMNNERMASKLERIAEIMDE